MKTKAVFLDRDGTLIENRGYIGDPDDVQLLPGASDAMRQLAEAGYLLVIASNQSGIARGLFDEQALDEVHARFEELLAADGAGIDGAYYCPYLDGPAAKVKKYRRDSELRKPKPGMLLQAARELNIDLKQSWMVGDSATDVEAGARAGCRTVLIGNGAVASEVEATLRASDLAGAAGFIIGKHPAGHQGDRPRVETPPKVDGARHPAAKTARHNDARVEPPAMASEEDEVIDLLARIHDLLDRVHRPKRQEDFSILRLLAALLQMFAIVAGLWGVFALMHDLPAQAAARLALACFLQLASVSAFAVDRFR